MSKTIEITRCNECPYATRSSMWPTRCSFLGEIEDKALTRFRNHRGPLPGDRFIGDLGGIADPEIPDNCPRPQLSFPPKEKK